MIAFVLAVAIAASPAVGQGPPTIDPGMTQAQVVAKLGEPLSARTYEGHTYLLYKNGCERSCGMSDLVVLDSGKVVDAIFRSNARRYSGASSSPRMILAADLHESADKSAIVVEPGEKPAKAEKQAKLANVEAPKVEGVDKAVQPAKAVKPAKVPTPAKVATPATVVRVEKVDKAEKVKVENGATTPSKPAAEKVVAPAPAAAPAPAPAAPPKLPEVFRPAPTPKKDTAKKSDAAIKPDPNKKPKS